MKKGFTLVELLAVILILAILAIASGVGIFSIINDSKNKLLEEQKKGALDAAITYMIKTKKYMKSYDNESQASLANDEFSCKDDVLTNAKSCYVIISELTADNLFDNKNDICNEDGRIIVYKVNSELKAKFVTGNECSY